MRAPACLYSCHTVFRKHLHTRRASVTDKQTDRAPGQTCAGGIAHVVTEQKLGVLAREDVVCDARDVVLVAEADAQLPHQRRLPAAHRPTDPDGKAAPVEGPCQWTLAVAKLACRDGADGARGRQSRWRGCERTTRVLAMGVDGVPALS